MTLRELINSVDSEQYGDSAMYQKLLETKPEYGSNRHIQVKLVNGKVTISNVHDGSMASNTFSDEEQAEFWDDFDRSATIGDACQSKNLQKAKIIR